MIIPGRSSTNTGFTLIEILLAFFIFGIVMATVFSSYSAITSYTDSIYDNIADYNAARDCLSRITDDLQGIYIAIPPAYKPPDTMRSSSDPYRIIGGRGGTADFSRLRFTSLAHLSMEQNHRHTTGIAEIVYYVQVKDERRTLRRADNLFPHYRFEETGFEEKGSDPALMNNVKQLEFVFVDVHGTEHDSWNSDSKDYKYSTPAGIKVRIEIGNENSSLLVETMVFLNVYRPEI